LIITVLLVREKETVKSGHRGITPKTWTVG
jgi:hypothetical protein